jgi:hypothetical protein
MRTHRTRPAEARVVERSIGTLWTLTRGESTARCILVALADGLDLRVLLDEARLRAERCDSHQSALELAGRWRQRMIDRGWIAALAGAPRTSSARGLSSIE